MASIGKTVTIIDIGTSKIHCIVARIFPDDFAIVGDINHKISGFSIGHITDMAEFKKSISQAIRKTESEAKCIIDNVTIILSGAYFSSEYLNAKLVLNSNPVKYEDIYSILNKIKKNGLKNHNKSISDNNPYEKESNEDTRITYSEIIRYEMDDEREVTNPIGMIGKFLKIRVHVLRAKTIPLQNIITSFASINVSINEIIFTPQVIGLAHQKSLSAQQSKPSNSDKEDRNDNIDHFTAIDIGASSIKICIIENGQFINQSFFSIGGNAITEAIATTANVSRIQAERLKILYGAATPLPHDENEMIFSVSLSNETIQIQRWKITSSINEKLKLIIRSVENQIQGEYVVLSGGVTLLPGICDLFSEILKKPVILANFRHLHKSIQIIGAESKSKLRYSHGIGNLMNVQYSAIIGSIYYIQKKINNDKSFFTLDKNKNKSLLDKFLYWISKKN